MTLTEIKQVCAIMESTGNDTPVHIGEEVLTAQEYLARNFGARDLINLIDLCEARGREIERLKPLAALSGG